MAELIDKYKVFGKLNRLALLAVHSGNHDYADGIIQSMRVVALEKPEDPDERVARLEKHIKDTHHFYVKTREEIEAILSRKYTDAISALEQEIKDITRFLESVQGERDNLKIELDKLKGGNSDGE